MESLCLSLPPSPARRRRLAVQIDFEVQRFDGFCNVGLCAKYKHGSGSGNLETRRRLGGFAPELTLALWGDRADVIVGLNFKLRYLNRRRRGDSGN